MVHGWSVPDERIFIDDGYSGGNLDRPGISRIRELVQAGEIQCVIVYKIDRLSRNIVDAVNLVLREWDGVCHLKCAMEPIDTSTELGRMIFSILAMFADFERSTIKARMFGGAVKRAEEGRVPGIRLPYGYRRGATPGTVEVVESQAAVVRHIFELYSIGRGPYSIAALLNEEGLTNRTGDAWSKPTIQKMLSNEAYIGRLIYGRSTANKRSGKGPEQRKRVPRTTPLVVKDDVYPVIVPPDLFTRCQELRRQKYRSMEHTSGRALSSSYLLTGLATCRCGHALQAWHSTSSAGRTPVYKCEGRWHKGLAFCDCGQIPQAVLEQIITDEVTKLTRPDVRKEFLERHAAEAETALMAVQSQITDTELRLKQLESEDVKLRRDYRAGLIKADSFEQMRSDIASDRAAAADSLEKRRVDFVRLQQTHMHRAQLEAVLDQVASWDLWDTLYKKQILRQLITSLVVYRPGRSKEIQVDVQYRVLELPPTN
jgi:site-specific DNA recombinase